MFETSILNEVRAHDRRTRSAMNKKPKLVFFQFKYEPDVPAFLLLHKLEHVECLAQFFDVAVVSDDCDFEQVCDRIEPELALFESGLELRGARRLRIRNTNRCGHVPKLALLNADGCTENRVAILSDLERWGIDAAFTISVCAGEHMVSIADRLFTWANFIDPRTYRDYGEHKTIPVLLTGSRTPRYPWRNAVFKLLLEHYPSLLCPHTGYVSQSPAGRMLYGEQYARTINAALFAPACGSVTRDLVRKQLEIPGCRSCLIAEASPALAEAGFVDMENCVLADERTVLEKVDYLFARRELLEAITDGGHRLVHGRHTIEHRNQIFQWFCLHRSLRSNQRIVQRSPFSGLVVVDVSSHAANGHLRLGALHLIHLGRGDRHFDRGRYPEAEREYLACLSYLSEFPEAKLKLALCELHLANPRRALSWIVQPLQCTLAGYKAENPDPVEWAYFIVCLLCLGRVRGAARRSRQFSWMQHRELDRVRWVVDHLATHRERPSEPSECHRAPRESIHGIAEASFADWVDHLAHLLEHCGQHALGRALSAAARSAFDDPGAEANAQRITYRSLGTVNHGRRKRFSITVRPTLRRLDNPELGARIEQKLRGIQSALRGRLLTLRPARLR
jgi:hypothetical protein